MSKTDNRPVKTYREFGQANPVQRYVREKRGRHNNITVSISKKDGALFGILDDFREAGMKMSETIVQAMWNTYGGTLLESMKQMILDDYKTGRLELPEKIRPDSLVKEPDFDSFEQILAQELKCTPIDDIAPKWNMRQSQFALLVFQYLTLLKDDYR